GEARRWRSGSPSCPSAAGSGARSRPRRRSSSSQTGTRRGSYTSTRPPFRGGGLGEQLLAKAFKVNREVVVITTKVGYASEGGKRDFSPDFLRKAVDASLARLESSYIDVLQLHHPDLAAVGNDAVWQTLEDLKSEGKIRYYGLASGP